MDLRPRLLPREERAVDTDGYPGDDGQSGYQPHHPVMRPVNPMQQQLRAGRHESNLRNDFPPAAPDAHQGWHGSRFVDPAEPVPAPGLMLDADARACCDACVSTSFEVTQ